MTTMNTKPRDPKLIDYMPKIDGKYFRCEDCGANVFRKPEPKIDPLLFTCNGCGTRWRGE
jgi:hypothetical protein